MDRVETYNRKNIFSQIKWLIKMVRYLLGKETSEGGNIQSIQEGDNISIDNTDPQNPIISALGGSGFMTLNSENEVTEDWAVTINNKKLYIDDFGNRLVFDSEGYVANISSEFVIQQDGFGNIASLSSAGIQGIFSGFWNLSKPVGVTQSSFLNFPITGETAYFIPISVNGEFADEYGNIELSGLSTPTLSEVIAEGNVTDGDLIIDEYSVLIFSSSNNYAQIHNNFGNGLELYYIDDVNAQLNKITIAGNGIEVYGDWAGFKGLEGQNYYGANYDDNTYVQKKYVDDNTMINPTLISGYDAGATQTLKNISGVLTWVTD